MRFLLGLAGLFLVAHASGQTAPAAEPPRLQAIVQSQRDSVGANLVKVSLLDPKYSVKTLQGQIEELGKLAGSGARGIQFDVSRLSPSDPDSRMVRATFAVDGIIDRKGQWVKVAPIIEAFAGTSANPGLSSFQIDFDFEQPSAEDLDSFSSPELDISRRVVDRSLEYSVLVKKRGANLVQVPDFAPTKTSSTSAIQPQTKPDWIIVVTVGVAILAVGALVYCLFLLNPSQRKARR